MLSLLRDGPGTSTHRPLSWARGGTGVCPPLPALLWGGGLPLAVLGLPDGGLVEAGGGSWAAPSTGIPSLHPLPEAAPGGAREGRDPLNETPSPSLRPPSPARDP